MVDVYTSALVFLGFLFAVSGYPAGEAVIGFMIGLYVLVRGFLYGKDAALVLMGCISESSNGQLMRVIPESVLGVKGPHDVRLRKSGPVFFGERYVELQAGLSLAKVHVISKDIEAKVKKHFQDLELVTVHVGLAHRKKSELLFP
jgi:divalent metal cation (Fe/Co/Zn/Cd) transporter